MTLKIAVFAAMPTASNVITVSHSLGRVPQAIVLTPHDTGNLSIVPPAQFSGATSSSFFAAATSQGAGSYSISYSWIAIG